MIVFYEAVYNSTNKPPNHKPTPSPISHLVSNVEWSVRPSVRPSVHPALTAETTFCPCTIKVMPCKLLGMDFFRQLLSSNILSLHSWRWSCFKYRSSLACHYRHYEFATTRSRRIANNSCLSQDPYWRDTLCIWLVLENFTLLIYIVPKETIRKNNMRQRLGKEEERVFMGIKIKKRQDGLA